MGWAIVIVVVLLLLVYHAGFRKVFGFVVGILVFIGVMIYWNFLAEAFIERQVKRIEHEESKTRILPSELTFEGLYLQRNLVVGRIVNNSATYTF